VGLVLTVTFSWSFSQTNLDSGIFFLGFGQGVFCVPGNTTYLTFSGDNTRFGGSESYTVALGRALADGRWSGSTLVQLRAGWGGSVDYGLATAAIFTKRVLANGSVVSDNNEISFSIDPARRSDFKCSLEIAVATVVQGMDGKVTITIPK
jgi:hypothetical protein